MPSMKPHTTLTTPTEKHHYSRAHESPYGWPSYVSPKEPDHHAINKSSGSRKTLSIAWWGVVACTFGALAGGAYAAGWVLRRLL